MSSICRIFSDLGISPTYAEDRGLTLQKEAPLSELVIHSIDSEGRVFVLHNSAASAWTALVEAAKQDRVTLLPLSGFRSYLYQQRLLERGLKHGKTISELLKSQAAPGYSEHHTGCAIDIICQDCPALSEDFEKTDAFAWLSKNAANFGFTMSFPRGNSSGFIYEPWHWCYQRV
ncbi:MAG: M15 family metallopeptidase [Bdellovibrionales bacterium]|nr:M15 family metallopeptidase [Bdellovibrionales bacterium]